MEIPVYASTGAFVTRANGRNFHLIPRIAPLLDCDGLEFMMYESWAGQEAEIAAEYVDLLQVPAFLCRQTDLLEACQAAGNVPLVSVDELVDRAHRMAGPMDPVAQEERIVGVIEWRDGTVIDVVRQLKKKG